MKSRRLLLVLVSAWFAAVALRAAVPQTPPEDAVSTKTGVYTAAQAQAGQEMYELHCLGGCHTASSHKGQTFKRNWDGHLLTELYQRIYETMPDDDPGSLTPKQGIELVAYLLKVNNMPAGKTDLPADGAALKKIRIDVPDKEQ